jgi:hypothetical protein
MPSVFGWVDYDPHERDRMTRILALFSEREARDELGIGAIRDCISDRLFPGTNTIMTRLRYMFFVPWVYRQLEQDGTSSAEVSRRARRLQTALVQPLLDKDEEGVLGRLARGELKRLPGSVYWAPLVSWGIYSRDEAQEDYHRGFDSRRAARALPRAEGDDMSNDQRQAWHPALPAAPETFPAGITFDLRSDEASFLRDRIAEKHSGSLLAWLVFRPGVVPDNSFVWEHPDLAAMSAAHRELLEHAQLFSESIYGAAILYNLMLAEVANRDDSRIEHDEHLRDWVRYLAEHRRTSALSQWNLSRFWELTRGQGHTISERSRVFVTQWLTLTSDGTLKSLNAPAARQLVRERERSLKKARSRFDNHRARDQWAGAAGLNRLDFRWGVTKRLLRDLLTGLEANHAPT